LATYSTKKVIIQHFVLQQTPPKIKFKVGYMLLHFVVSEIKFKVGYMLLHFLVSSLQPYETALGLPQIGPIYAKLDKCSLQLHQEVKKNTFAKK
jgi:hypothetical protein